MERIEKDNNTTYFYMRDTLVLTITVLGDHKYEVVNNSYRIVGYVKALDDINTVVSIFEHYSKGKNNRWYKTKKLIDHNSRWFSYILSAKGFLNETSAVR